MLAGLLFAIEEAAGDPGRLVAALPVAGATVVEYQARQLIVAGATRIVVIADRASPELDGALQRIGRRGVAVDRAVGAREAAAMLHPLARVVMLADGLVAPGDMVASFALGEGEALLVVPLDAAPRGFERIGSASAWAGIARIDARRLAELAELPPDYAPQSTLLRLVAAAGASHLPLTAGAIEAGHAIVDDVAALADSERRMVAAALRPRGDWFDRSIAAPLLRLAMPPLVTRRVDTAAITGLAVALASGGIAAIAADLFGWGLLAAVAAMLAGMIGVALADLRDQRSLARTLRAAMLAMAAAATLLLGWRCDVVRGGGAGLPVAIALVAATALVERAGAAPARWWGGAASCMLVVAAATVLGWPLVGLVLATLYVVATLALAIEALRPA